jgi:predicted transcriptional regulator
MATTVRISENSRALLSQLAKEADTSMTAVLDAALEAYRRHRFLIQAAIAYEALSADTGAAADYRRELTELEATSADGLDAYTP